MIYWLLAVSLYWVLGIAYYGSKRETYSHFRHTISELGESGSAFERQVGFFIFLPVGIGLMLIGYGLLSLDEHLALLSTVMGLSYFLSAFFPCDPGTPLAGSWKNSIHNLIGGVCYAVMIYQLRELSDQGRGEQFGIAFVPLAAFLITFIVGWPKQLIGLAQRVAETGVFVSLLISLS